MKELLSPLYCSLCHKKLAFYTVLNGTVEIKCRMTSCRALNRISCENGICKQTFLVEPAYLLAVDNSEKLKV